MPMIIGMIFMLISTHVFSQNRKSVRSNSYALIIGISDYEHEGIEDLNFADKDAEIFAAYLQSPAGGSIPAQNITLLLNKQATHTAMYQALDWFSDSCKTNDTVYIYFSGHGDVENIDVYKKGFLLSYNTPRLNYINFSLSVEDLNFYANYLSLQTKAKVIMITDACHAGVLAGNEIRGKFLVDEQLRTIVNNEIRLNSCTADQLSNEDAEWGGGRGVFSYYLLNGLLGFADSEKDQKISVHEIRQYLDSNLRKDPILKAKRTKQNPIIQGNDQLILAHINEAALQKLIADTIQLQTVSTSNPPAYQFFFDKLTESQIENNFDFYILDTTPAQQIPVTMLSMFLKQYPDEKQKVDKLNLVLLKNPDANRRFVDKIVDMLDQRSQHIIELYLSGDEAELERRRYYSMLNSNYDVYPKMLGLACRLSNPAKPLYKMLQSKYHYFSGVVARIQTALVANPDSLISIAFAEQFKANEFQEDVAYIHNELGILFHATKKYKEADSCFLLARKIAPTWAMPWTNLVSVYAKTNQFEKGLTASQRAINLDENYSSAYVNTGILYEGIGNYLYAEDRFRKAIDLNSRHYLPFERLAFVYLNTNQYALADSFFFEADLRKRGFYIHEQLMAVEGLYRRELPKERVISCEIPTKINDRDIIVNFMAGLIYLQKKDTLNGERYLKKVIDIDTSNPLAFHELGKVYWKQHRWAEADIMFGFAKKYYLRDSLFLHYSDSIAKLMNENDLSENEICLLVEFEKSHYPLIEDYFYHGSVFEKWKHIDEAIVNYREAVTLSSPSIEAYYKLWKLFESIGRYEEAENTIMSHPEIEVRDKQLHALYHRVTKQFPQSGAWHYKAGNFMYDKAAANPQKFSQDKTYRIADYNLRSIASNEDTGFFGKGITSLKGKELTIDYTLGRMHEMDEFGGYIPGTLEEYFLGIRINHPFSEGLQFLKVADTFISDKVILADVDEKIGDIYTWKGLYQKSPPYYRKSLALQNTNAGVRTKLVESLDRNYAFMEAILHLDTMNASGGLNYDNILRLGRYNIHACNFSLADSLLKHAEKIHPYSHPEMNEWKGRMHFMAKQPEKALSYYEAYAKRYPSKWTTSYTMAQIYVQLQDKTKAIQYLQQAIDEGFNLGWVLLHDANWNEYHNLLEWKQLTAKIKPKEYRSDFTVNP